MRKRAQIRSKPTLDEPKHVAMKIGPKEEEKNIKNYFKKNWWITVSLIGIFLLILFLNTWFNASSEISIDEDAEGFDKFYLSGPDPYYNRRLVEVTYETGEYPFYSEDDPLLNYPLGRSGARPPLFNMMSLGFSRLLTPFMGEVEAIGYSMQFVPALFGALLCFPVYFLGAEIFNKKAGLIGALFVAIIPIHLGSGHGSAFSLFDHDSFNLLLFTITFLFLVKSIKEKDSTKSFLYAILGGVALGALSMTWVKSQELYVIIAIYVFIQLFIDLFRNKIEFDFIRNTSVIMFTGYLISLPVIMAGDGKFSFDVNAFLCLGVLIFGLICYMLRWRKIPWTLSIPAIFGVGIIGLIVMHPSVLQALTPTFSFLGPLGDISEILYGAGIYGGKVSMTIAEANTYEISHSVMSFGPAMYWVGWTGFLFIIYYFYKDKNPPGRDFLFLVVLFIVNIWLTGIAGRFINDMVPLIAILAAWIVWMVLEWIDYKQMIRNIRSAGGGFHGIRRGVKFLHVFGIFFIVFLVVLPNAFIAFDAAVPVNAQTDDPTVDLKEAMFGEEHAGAFGLGIGKERYWSAAFEWLSQQDTHIENPADRPAFISWWDYGFYEVAMGEHPTVADNFQDGIAPAANFHTATSEEEAVVVLIVRLLEGDVKKNDRSISPAVRNVLNEHLKDDVNNTDNASMIIAWMEDPTTAPSYGKAIDEEYHEYVREEINREHLSVGVEWKENAAYHDIVEFLLNESYGFSDEEITMLYHDIQEATGWSIRYYGVEGYDRQIFNIFAFLSDKSLLMVGAPKDDFVEIYLEGYTINSKGEKDPPGNSFNKLPLVEYLGYPEDQKRFYAIIDQTQNYLQPYFDTMFYKTYYGPAELDLQFTLQLPCVDMKHFYAEYMSDISKPYSQYYTGIAAVVIAKYYEGVKINGTVMFDGNPIGADVVVTNDVAYTSEDSYDIDHDSVSTIDGYFDLIAGADAKLQIRRYPELDIGIPWFGIQSFVMKEIDLNISDDDAMRKTDNWMRNLGNVTIEPGSINGFVYNNTDDNSSYNIGVDTPVPNATVKTYEVLEFDETEAKQNLRLIQKTNTLVAENLTDKNGSYTLDGLKPGYYILETRVGEYETPVGKLGIPIDRSILPVESGNLTINITNPKQASIEGKVYYDENSNNEMDSDEKVDNANVTLIYLEPDPNTEYIEVEIANTTTDSEGFYSFESITPGRIGGIDINKYRIRVEKLPEYKSDTTVSPEENKTTSLNISTSLAPITVYGLTKHGDDLVGNISVDFIKDSSIAGNTAINSSTPMPSNVTTAYYTADIIPGDYIVKAQRMEGETRVYSYEGTLKLTKGQDSVSLDISLVKESIQITGFTKDRATGEIVEGVTVEYTPDTSVPNNNATITVNPVSGSDGSYTVELTRGTYKVNASKNDIISAGTVIYSANETIEFKSEDDGSSRTIYVDKKSVNVSGIVTGINPDYGLTNEEIVIYFDIDGDVENNTAFYNIGLITAGNTYSVELTPGTYILNASSNLFNISSVNYTYTTTGSLVVKETDISTGITNKNIALDIRKEE